MRESLEATWAGLRSLPFRRAGGLCARGQSRRSRALRPRLRRLGAMAGAGRLGGVGMSGPRLFSG